MTTVDMTPVWKRIESAINGALWESALLFEREVVLEIERGGQQVTGGLKGSITSEVNEAAMTATVGSNYKTAVFTHEGTDPHWAPIQPLRLWVHRKFGLKGTDVEKMARAVQHSIARKGTKPHPFFRAALDKWQKRLPQVLHDLIAKRMA